MGTLAKIRRFCRDYGVIYTAKKVLYRGVIKYYLGAKYCPVTIPEEERMEQAGWMPDREVKISIVVPLYNTKEIFLREMIESVLWQTYGNWELCLADASDDMECRQRIRELVQQFQQKDDRICYRVLDKNEGISENTNRAMEMSTGDYIALLDHDDILHPSALFDVMQEINYHQGEFIYTDELSFDGTPRRVQNIHFKPDFSPESFRSNNYICHFSVFSRQLLDKTGGFRKEFDGSQDYDMLLRLTDEADNICHVPKVRYYWRVHPGSVASSAAAKPYTIDAGKRALEEHLTRRNLKGNVEAAGEYGPFYRVHYQVPEQTKVLLMAETEQVAGWLRKDTGDLPYDMTICPVILPRFEVDEHPFDVIVLVREGYRPEKGQGEWLQELLSSLVPKENMVAAPVVYDRHHKVFHAGYGYCAERPEQIFRLYHGVPAGDPSYMYRLAFRQNVSLAGGAVLAVKEEVYSDWVEENLEVGTRKWNGWGAFSDQTWFSLCLKAKKRWGDCVYTPYSPWTRMISGREAVASKTAQTDREHWRSFFAMWDRMLKKGDPHGNPGMEVFGKYYFLGNNKGFFTLNIK